MPPSSLFNLKPLLSTVSFPLLSKISSGSAGRLKLDLTKVSRGRVGFSQPMSCPRRGGGGSSSGSASGAAARLAGRDRPQVLRAAAQALPWAGARLSAVLQSYNLSQVRHLAAFVPKGRSQPSQPE